MFFEIAYGRPAISKQFGDGNTAAESHRNTARAGPPEARPEDPTRHTGVRVGRELRLRPTGLSGAHKGVFSSMQKKNNELLSQIKCLAIQY